MRAGASSLLAAVLLFVMAACSSGTRDGHGTTPSDVSTADTTTADTTTADTSAAGTRAGGAPRPPRTLRVPGEFPTIQAAVDATVPGDLVLVAPGTYHEGVVISTERVVLRGEDRNTVVLDGGFELDNGVLAQANGIAVENLTVHGYVVNGILFTKAFIDDGVDYSADPTKRPVLDGYRASYVTAYDNEQYGVYAFFARNGQIDHAYASGHPDSGFYIGQCKPCNAVLTDSVAEANAIGYEGTNASGATYIVHSVFRRNRVGITPNSQNMEKLAPQGDVVVAGNLVEDGNDPATPEAAKGAYGLGIAVGGGTNDRILRNRVRRNAVAGILVSDLNEFLPVGNTVEGNVLEGNGVDLVYEVVSTPGGAARRGNCFAGNSFASSLPERIESELACGAPVAGGDAGPSATDPPGVTVAIPPRRVAAPPPGVDYRQMPAPPPQPGMPDAASSPARPAVDVPMKIDVSAITVPQG